jgi:hypothetical protein
MGSQRTRSIHSPGLFLYRSVSGKLFLKSVSGELFISDGAVFDLCVTLLFKNFVMIDPLVHLKAMIYSYGRSPHERDQSIVTLFL